MNLTTNDSILVLLLVERFLFAGHSVAVTTATEVRTFKHVDPRLL